jgi:hypothetical protein
MKVMVDGRLRADVDLAVAPVELPLAEGLAAGSHSLELTFNPARRLPILGFRVLSGSHGAIGGKVTGDAPEYLNDISVGIYRDGQLLDERLDRNPYTGEILIWGLEPGTYDLHLHALGWQDQWIRGVQVAQGRMQVNSVHLSAAPVAVPHGPIVRPNRGCPIFVKPGGQFPAAYTTDKKTTEFSAALVGSLNTHDLRVVSASFDTKEEVWQLELSVPDDVPDDLYNLRVSCSAGGDQASQAVCVRREYGRHFRVVKFGHMDTWTQRNARYVRSLAELANLINPDVVLISNEVNWHYLAGALSVLRVPYLVTPGNHSLPGFERYFGPTVGWLRAGDVFVANFGLDSPEAASVLPDVFKHAGDAHYRILQGVEADLPEQVGRQLGVNFYAFGHGFTNEWLKGRESPPWLHLGKEFHLVTIDLATGKATAAAVVDSLSGMAAKYPIPRDEPWSPVAFEPANDGRHHEVKAKVRNPLTVALKDARLRFIMPAGSYRTNTGRIVRATPENSGKLIEIEVAVDVPAKGQSIVMISPAAE